MRNFPFIIALLTFSFFAQTSCAQNTDQKTKTDQRIVDQKSAALALLKKNWIDSVYNSLNQQERIGQLFMVAAYSGGKNLNSEAIEKLVKNHQIGGLIFMQGTPEAQARLTNQFQEQAQVPLLIGMDAEWGLGMRLTGVTDYPKQMMMGATQNTALMYEMGKEIANQCKRLGVHINFAPVVDVNNNPKNPIINFRSFGEDKNWVSKLGIAYMQGMQDNGVIACAKHFPGHGDVSVDSHHELPVINKSKSDLEDLELYPFKQLINAGVKSIMVAHLSIPSLDNTVHLPSTLSKKIITDLMINEMKFNGLIFTDALNMKGVTKYYPDGETDLKAFLAGNDVLLFSQDVPLAISKIENAIQDGKADQKQLENSVKKILATKYDVGLAHFKQLEINNITSDINASTERFNEKAAQKSITLIKDENKILQKINEPNAKVAYLSVNNSGIDYLKNALVQKYSKLNIITSATINQYDAVIVGIHSYATYPGRTNTYGLTAVQINLIKRLDTKTNVIFVILGNAYIQKNICAAKSVIVSYEDNIYTEKAAFNVIEGSLKPQGQLPVTSCN